MTTPTIVIDTREPERTAWTFGDTPTVRKALVSADYSILGLENEVGIERKELGDAISSLIGANRERFFRELERLSRFKRALVIVESDAGEIFAHRYRSRVSPACIFASFASAYARWNIPTVFAGTKAQAQAIAKIHLLKLAKYHLPPLEVAS